MSAPTPDAIGAEQITELRRLLDAATVRPWFAAVGQGPKRRKQQHAVIGRADMRGTGQAGALAVFSSTDGRKADNAELAVAAVNAAPVLLAEIDRLRAEMAAAQEREARVQRRFFDECETAGWDPAKRNSFAEECAHLHEEVSEAFREWRLHKNFEIRYGNDGKPTGIPIELADVLIGLFYNAELHGFDLMAATEIKHRWNLTRRYQDEGRTLHPIAALADPAPSGETP